MKNTINLMIALMLLLALYNTGSLRANPVFDGNGLIVKVAPSEQPRSIDLRMANLEKALTKVKVLDIWGYALLSQMVTKRDGYSHRINLNNLPIGEYVLRIEHPSGSFNHAFKLTDKTVVFFDAIMQNEGFVKMTGQKKAVFSMPNCTVLQEKLLDVKVGGLQGNRVEAHICNLSGRVFQRTKVKQADTFRHQFDTTSLPEGEFMLVVRSDDRMVIQPFVKSDTGLQLNNTLLSKAEASPEMEIYSQQ